MESVGVVNRRWVWLTGGGCGCKEVYIYSRSCYLCGSEIYANLLKLPTKFMREIFMRFKHDSIIGGGGGCLTYMLNFILDFNYADFLSLA